MQAMLIMPRCACASEVYGSVCVSVYLCVCMRVVCVYVGVCGARVCVCGVDVHACGVFA